VPLIRQVLEAARFAHRHGIVHRDLKPQNVIVDSEGKAAVTDFGIARAGVSEITQTGSVMGTPHYLSPEQAQGMDTTAVSDLYSIGVILYEALTGRVPFEGESAVAVAMKQVSQTPQRPSSINPRVSPALDAAVMRALEKDPGQRFQSADAFIAALDQAMREPGAPAGGTASFAPLPPVVAVPEEAEAEEDPEEAARKRRRRILLGVLAAILIGALIGYLAARSNPTTDVPNVTGKQLEFAILQLERKGFDVGEEKFVERQAPRNEVLEQEPVASPPGDRAEEDCSFLTLFCSKPTVDLTISAGPGTSQVPATAGLSQQEAAEKLENAGLEADVERANSASVAEGSVIHSEPSAGSTVTNGSAVTIVVSRGPKLTKVPVLVGTQRSAAVQRIRGSGFTPSIGEEESSKPAGEVLSQSPDAGSELEPGSTVSIVVSAGETRVTVPNEIGKLRREAVEAMRAAGLGPFVEEEETEVPSQVGRVIDQFPPPGKEVEEGAEVTLVVGKLAAGEQIVPEGEE
jgi:beta-lactam-binding protein with PASTA domain